MKTIGSVLKRLLLALGGSAAENYLNDITLVDRIAELAENGRIPPSVIQGLTLPLSIDKGGTGANNIATARANLQAAQMITPDDLAGYGLSVSGSVYNFTLAQLFQAVPTYSRVVIPWIQSQNTTRFGTLAGELPTGSTDYGMLTLEKSASIGEFRFIRYSTSNVFHGSFTTVNSRGFNGWVEDKS